MTELYEMTLDGPMTKPPPPEMHFQDKDGEASRGTIRCYPSLKLVDPWNINPDDIEIDDIAHSLALQARYAGHSRHPISIAEHCVRVSDRMRDRNYYDTPYFRLAGLLHDAEEAYLLDMPSPIKHRPEMASYREAGKRLRAAIFYKFGVDPSHCHHTKWADEAEYYRERRQMWPTDEADYVKPWEWRVAQIRFYERFTELTHAIKYGVGI